MSHPVELPLDTKCYLCDTYYANSQESFFAYKCFLCMKFTSYCMSCELKLQKLFGKGNFFKCMFCDKLTNALDKLEIASQKAKYNINNNSFFKTPSKPFMENNIPISSIRQNNKSNFFINNNEEERKDNNNIPNNMVISNFLNDFNKININLALNKKSLNDNKSISSLNTNNKIFLNRNINSSDTSKLTNRTLTNYMSSRSRGKFKNLISMKMSKMYRNENNISNNNEGMEETLNEYRKKNCEIKNVFLSSLNSINKNGENSGIRFNLLKDNNKNNNNIFINRQKEIMNFSTIDGKTTPHRLSSNNSFEYF